jgi:hypothetical protein
MEQHDETHGAEYPLGRGYGHDYMRGGEVFGGYGYCLRGEYDRPRGELKKNENGAYEHELAPSDEERLERADLIRARLDATALERFPQDERAGGWDVPHDLGDAAPQGSSAPVTPSHDSSYASAAHPHGDAPVPQLEGTFGDSGGNRRHSRSFYVTQAQLQQRLYAPRREAESDRTPGSGSRGTNVTPADGSAG